MQLEAQPSQFFLAFQDKFTKDASIGQASTVRAVLDRDLLPAVAEIIPPRRSRRGVTANQYDQLWIQALECLSREVGSAIAAGETKEALSLNSVLVSAATSFASSTKDRLTYSKPGSPSERSTKELALQAARHQVLVVAAQVELSGDNNPVITLPQGRETIEPSRSFLESRLAEDLYGEQGKRQLRSAISTTYRARFRGG